MKLYIDSTSTDKITVKIGDKDFVKNIDSHKDRDIFSYLFECFEESKTSLSQITSIEVNTGPGSFTGTRVGVTIANSLAFALGVLVNNQLPPVFPIYSSSPHTTSSKPR